MGFSNGNYARIWSVNDKGNYATVNLTTSRKNKDTGSYETTFKDGYVRFVSSAYDFVKNLNIDKNGLSIKIDSCDVTNKYDAEKKKLYTNFVVFACSSAEDKSKKNNEEIKRVIESVSTDEEIDDLPF